MINDVDLMRELMFVLEQRQVSPRETVIIAIEAEALDLGCLPATVKDSLNVLLDLEYVEGPGSDVDGTWLFRKLTRKGVQFVRAVRDPQDWDRMKQDYAHLQVPEGT